jgi:hypothetical protein
MKRINSNNTINDFDNVSEIFHIEIIKKLKELLKKNIKVICDFK